VDAIFEAYLAAQRRRRRSALTIKATTHALRAAQRWLDENGTPAGELTLIACEEYFDQLLERGAVATVQRHLAYLRAAYQYGVRHELVARDPTADVKLPRLPDLEPATYANEQLRDIHAAIRSERDELAFYLFAFAGLRLGELAALTWRQVDLEHSQLKLTGKGGKFRLVPLHPVLNDILVERQQNGHRGGEHLIRAAEKDCLAAATLGRAVRALVDRAGISVDSPSHAFRRTVATVMYEHGVRTRVIERIMGWAPRTMHERHYLRVCDEPMREAILTLYREDPVCDLQREIPRRSASPKPSTEPAAWLTDERTRLEQLERELGLRAE
jgi:site-specific recombinase XerD